MSETGQRLRAALDGYAKFLRGKELALPKHQPYLVRWVGEFLRSVGEHTGYTFEQTLELVLADVGRRVGIKPWQVQQAADAARVYRDQYRGADARGQAGAGNQGAAMDDASSLARLREVIRLRHCARSTDRTYLHWPRRFLAYRRQTGLTGGPTAADVKSFLTRPAMVRKVSASTPLTSRAHSLLGELPRC